MKKILQQKEKVLHQNAHEVHVADIKTKKIQNVLKEMSQALRSQDDGVAIAAPQIGYPLRIFVVSGKILAKDFGKSMEERLLNKNNIISGEKQEKIKPARAGEDLVFINPKVSKLSREKEWMPEGCLSVRWLYGKTFRSKKATITAYDKNGKKFQRGASGLLAQIFQHETDHLKGVLFTDHAKDIKEELPPVK
jgi:peptide deformylase